MFFTVLGFVLCVVITGYLALTGLRLMVVGQTYTQPTLCFMGVLCTLFGSAGLLVSIYHSPIRILWSLL